MQVLLQRNIPARLPGNRQACLAHSTSLAIVRSAQLNTYQQPGTCVALELGYHRSHSSQTLCRCQSNAEASTSASASSIDLPPQLREPSSPDEYCIVNFYHLVDLQNPVQTTEEHRRWIQQNGLDIRGRVYISSQGINAQYGGTVADATAYAKWLSEQNAFRGLQYTVWPVEGHAFPKLRLKYKPNLISLAGGMENFPITDPSQRATPLEPADWKKMIAEAEKKNIVVLDIRNDYEWDAGHFVGAHRPQEEVFNETPVGEASEDIPAPLQGVDPDAPIMMYCTGGIRCDVYSAFLRQKGFKNMYTLHGGIQNYLRQEGGEHWKGSLFVFDGRMAIPATGNARADAAAGAAPAEAGPLPAAVPCRMCGSPDAQLPHINCANIDCNELFIACAACKTRYNGACCEGCMNAPRLLRPAKLDGGHYGNWGNYAGEDLADKAPLIAIGRSVGRKARRQRRREALKDKRMAVLEEKLARKSMVREAMARVEAAEAAAAAAGEQGANKAEAAQKDMLAMAL